MIRKEAKQTIKEKITGSGSGNLPVHITGDKMFIFADQRIFPKSVLFKRGPPDVRTFEGKRCQCFINVKCNLYFSNIEKGFRYFSAIFKTRCIGMIEMPTSDQAPFFERKSLKYPTVSKRIAFQGKGGAQQL